MGLSDNLKKSQISDNEQKLDRQKTQEIRAKMWPEANRLHHEFVNGFTKVLREAGLKVKTSKHSNAWSGALETRIIEGYQVVKTGLLAREQKVQASLEIRNPNNLRKRFLECGYISYKVSLMGIPVNHFFISLNADWDASTDNSYCKNLSGRDTSITLYSGFVESLRWNDLDKWENVRRESSIAAFLNRIK